MSLAADAAGLLGAQLESRSRLAGGDLSEVVAIDLVDGRTAVAKRGPAPPIEAGMLEAIRHAGAPAPRVLAYDDTLLVLERLPEHGRLGTAWGDLGRVLTKLHDCTGPGFGWSGDYAFGDVAIENAWTDDWVEFWARRRLSNQLAALPPRTAQRIEALVSGLANRLPRAPAASLLHGDLWTGNVLAAGSRISGLIDPACYYGHREVDLAMLCLFGSPDGAFHAAYDGLEPGHAERLPIYQLWPALVHFRLFGAGYLPLVERLLAQLGV